MLISLYVTTFLVLSEFTCIPRTEARSLRMKTETEKGGEEKAYWRPANGTREEWIDCRGLPCHQWRRSQDRLAQLFKDVDLSPGSASGEVNDILLTEAQLIELDSWLARSSSAGKPVKMKRATTKSAFQLWKLPIHYIFDGFHSDIQRQVIRDALQHWMDNTCVRFTEIPVHHLYDDHHVIFTREAKGCFSYTGLIDAVPQQINLDDHCLETFGRPVHEIGHVLGLWHEQQRTDRDDSVEVLDENIGMFKNQFSKHWDVSPLNVPYELGSVMHYSPRGGSRNGELTLRARNPLYQRNIGQRTGLSFGDAHYINMVYCKGFCKERLQRPCEHDGYQDPNSCHVCKCPDGFSGDFCQELAKPENGVCGGVLELKSAGEEQDLVIESPGYAEDRKSYEPHTSCTWLFKVPVDQRIQIRFVDEFGLFCQEDACYHWVEVRYHRNLAREGPRFCCKSTPGVTVTSESNEMMVVFRSNWTTTADNGSLRGFRAVVRTVSMEKRLEPTTRSVVHLPVDSLAATSDSTDTPAVTSDSTDTPAVTSESTDTPAVTSNTTDTPAVTSDTADSPAATSDTTDSLLLSSNVTDSSDVRSKPIDSLAIASEAANAPSVSPPLILRTHVR